MPPDAARSRLRVALVNNWLGMGGTEKGLVNHATALDRERFDVRVVIVRGDGPRRAELEDAGIPVHVAYGDPSALAEALRGVDIVHVFRTGLTEPAVPEACRRSEVPHLIETNVFGRIDASRDERQFDCHLFVGKMCAWRYRERVGPRDASFHDRHRVLHWPVDIRRLHDLAVPRTDAKARLGLDPQRPVLGRIGRDDDSKWRRLLIDMLPHLLELAPETQILIVGATREKRRRLEHLGLTDRVVFADTTVEEADVVQRFCACDVFVTAAEIGESYSVAISEAMALGLPVVTCSTPWVDNGQIEQVDNGVTGYVSDHPTAFAEACADLVRNPGRAAAFGRAGAAKAERLMDRVMLTRQLERLYEGLAYEGAPPRDWIPSLDEVDAFGAEYARRQRNVFRPLTKAERRDVQVARWTEQARWAWRAAGKLNAGNIGFASATVRARLRRLVHRTD